MTSSSIAARLTAGDLAGALEEATAAVKAAPADVPTRGLLAEILIDVPAAGAPRRLP